VVQVEHKTARSGGQQFTSSLSPLREDTDLSFTIATLPVAQHKTEITQNIAKGTPFSDTINHINKELWGTKSTLTHLINSNLSLQTPCFSATNLVIVTTALLNRLLMCTKTPRTKQALWLSVLMR